MGADDSRPDADLPTDDIDVLRAENARLAAQLHRIVASLEQRRDIGVRVRLHDDDASVDVEVVKPLPPEGLVEVREVSERLSMIKRDMARLQQQVEKLLWRMGDREPTA